MDHLVAAVFGVPELATARQAPPPPHIECVGCRLADRIGAVDAFVDVHASNTPDQTLFRLAADLHETRLKPTLGHGAPEWGHEALRQHYTTCCYDQRRTLMAMLRDLRGIAEMIHTTVRRAEASGSDASDSLALYLKVGKLQTQLQAQLQRMGPPSQRTALPPLQKATAPSPPIRADTNLTARPALPTTSPLRPLSVGGVGESDSWDDDAASVASTARAGFDVATAEEWLRGALSDWIEPCTPPPTAIVQPLLSEMVQRTSRADVRARHQLLQLREFQQARPSGGRRCFCPSSHSGGACAVRLDKSSLCALLEEAPAGVRQVYSDAPALRSAIQKVLRVGSGPIQTRPPYAPLTLFGFRRRKRSASPSH